MVSSRDPSFWWIVTSKLGDEVWSRRLESHGINIFLVGGWTNRKFTLYSPFPIGNITSNGAIFHCYVSLPKGNWWFLISLVVEPTHLKNMIVKLDIVPNFRVENKTYLSCHYPVFLDTKRDVFVWRFQQQLSTSTKSQSHLYKLTHKIDQWMIYYAYIFLFSKIYKSVGQYHSHGPY